MKIYRSFNEDFTIKNPVVTTGSFDGVHIGHKAIINRINKIASDSNGESVLVTFYPHPRKVLYPNEQGKELKFINSLEEKIQMLQAAGLNHLFIINFTYEFSLTTSEEFVNQFLVGKLKAKVIVVGFNHHFGHNRTGDYRYLFLNKDKYGIEVEEIPEQELHHETISSTKIRGAICDGNIQKANAYLDSYYFIYGKINRILRNMKHSGMEIVVDFVDKLLPPNGSYVISSFINGKKYKGAAYVANDIYLNSKQNSGSFFVWFIEKCNTIQPLEKIAIYFHKRIEGCTLDKDSFYQQFVSEKDFIEELVF